MAGLDTPDNTRGVVSAQILLGQFPKTTQTERVGVPPSAETIVVVGGNGGAFTDVQAVGVESGTNYSGLPAATFQQYTDSSIWYLDVSSVVDPEIDITITPTIAEPWYVYADAASHFSVVPPTPSGDNSVPFTTPVIPGITTYSHPPTEVTVKQFSTNVTANVLPAPGTASRYRLFSVDLILTSGAAACSLNDVVASTSFAFVIGAVKSSLTIPAQGVPMATNSPLEVVVSGGSTDALATVCYVLETV